MATDNPFLKAVGASGTKAGSNPFLDAANGVKKKDSSILGGLKQAAGGALGNVLQTLSAPQQAIFKPIQGIRKTIQGEGWDETWKGLRGGLGESLSFMAGVTAPGAGNTFLNKMAGDDISFTDTIGAKKLPFGLETAGGILTDPLTYLTLGVGGAAKSALQTGAKAGLKSITDDVAKVGLKKVVAQNPAAKGALESAFRDAATSAGARNVEKTVAKNMKALTRAQGGVGFKVPFGRNFQAVSGDTLSKTPILAPAGRAAKAGIKDSRLGVATADRFKVGARAARDLDVGADSAAEARTVVSEAASGASKKIADSQTEWAAAVRATEKRGLKYTVEQDTLVREALEAGPDARAALLAAEPRLAPVLEAADRIRKAIGDDQFKAGVIGRDYTEAHARLVGKVDEGLETAGRLGDEHTTIAGQAKQAASNSRQATATAEKLRAQNRTAGASVKKTEGALARTAKEIAEAEAKVGDSSYKKFLAEEVKAAREALEIGRPLPGVTKSWDLASDPTLMKRAADRAASEGMASPRLQTLRAKGLKQGEELQAAKAARETTKGQISELQKLASGARKAAVTQAGEAGRLGARAAKSRRELNKLGDALADMPEGVAGLKDPDTYMRRLLTPAAKKLLRGAKGREMRASITGPSTGIGSAAQGAVIQRKIAQGYTAKSINDAIELIRTGKKGLVDQELLDDKDFMAIANRLAESKKAVKLFDEGTAVPLMARQAEAARAVSTANAIKGLKEITGEANRPILLDAADRTARMQTDEGFKRYVKIDVPGMGEYYVPPGLQEEMKQAFWTLQPDTVTGALKAANKWQAFWKTYATAMLPGGVPFAMRNMRSNFYLNMLDGIPPTSKAYARAAGTMRQAHKIAKGDEFAEDIARLGLDDVLRREMGDKADLLFEAQKRGILDKSFFDIDFEDFAQTAKELGVRGATPEKNVGMRAGKFLFSTKGQMAQKGRGLNQMVEHHARLSNFMHNVERLGSLDEAAAHTKAALFDYSALTPFEQKIMKNVIPFYTFMRKNIPNQYKSAINDPRFLTTPEHVMGDELTVGAPEDAPDYMKRGNARMPAAQGLMGALGLGGLVSSSDRPLAAAADVVDPIASLITAGAKGAGLTQAGSGEPAGWAPFFRSVDEAVGGPIPGLLRYLQEEGAGKSDFTGGTLPDATDNRVRRALDALVPGLGRSLRVSGTANSAVGGPEDKRGKDASMSELLRFLTGLRMDDVGTAAGGGRASTKKDNPFLKK